MPSILKSNESMVKDGKIKERSIVLKSSDATAAYLLSVENGL